MLSSDTAFIHSDMGGMAIMLFVGDFLNNPSMNYEPPPPNFFTPITPFCLEGPGLHERLSRLDVARLLVAE